MHHRAELPPRAPVAADVERAWRPKVVEEARDVPQLRDLDLTPVLDLLGRVESAQGSAGLVEEERERVEERRSGRRVDAAIRDPCEEPANFGLEPGLFVRLANEGIEDRLAAVDPAGGEAVGTARIEGLDREQTSP